MQEESGAEDHDTLDLYQQSLGELLLALAGKLTHTHTHTKQQKVQMWRWACARSACAVRSQRHLDLIEIGSPCY